MIEEIKKQIIIAMKARDSVRLSTLKMLSSEIKNAEIDSKNNELTEDEILAVVKREVKKRKDAIDSYKKAGNVEKADLENQELEVLMEYMPEQLDEEQVYMLVEKAISETGASGMQDMGKVMGAVIKLAEGKADGSVVSKIVREKLS